MKSVALATSGWATVCTLLVASAASGQTVKQNHEHKTTPPNNFGTGAGTWSAGSWAGSWSGSSFRTSDGALCGTSSGFVPFYPPPILVFPVPYPYPVPVATPVPVGGGLMLPNPDVPAVAQPKAARLPVRPDGKKANELIVIGDRLFKAGNIKRAEERYEQARRSNPNSATPQIRLAQIALSRNDYAKAAEVIRLATTTEPGWYLVANDIQALYNEPADFAKVIGKLESHLQRSPNDRDAWLVLGTQFYLSGRSRQAGDVFRRLNDRKPDTTLAAMLDATTPDAPPKPKP